MLTTSSTAMRLNKKIYFFAATGLFGLFVFILAASVRPLTETTPETPLVLGVQIVAKKPSLGLSTWLRRLPPSTLNTTPSATFIRAPVSKKSNYKIALYGDSMIETMGENLPVLRRSLQSKYPKITFELYNYGVGGQNVAQGLVRFDQPFTNQTRNYPPISELRPDVIILGSFAYNPYSDSEHDRYWLELSQLEEKAKRITPKVYQLVEIAPLSGDFGKGPNGINWSNDLRLSHAKKITNYLNNALGVAKTMRIPVIDAYAATKTDGKFGSWTYTDKNDGIHPSFNGQTLTANLITSIISLD